MTKPLTMDIRTALKQAAARLADVSDSPSLDADILMCFVLARPRGYLVAWGDQPLSSEQDEQFESYIERRGAGEPVAHITGQREFWSLNIEVNRHTLIPRPDTELLVETALELIPKKQTMMIVDLGTGSGAVGLAIAWERHQSHVTAVDNSFRALEMAKKNARSLHIMNIDYHEGDWCEPLGDERFQIIVSNPPYVPENDPHLQTTEIQYEPRRALAAGEDGLDAIRAILQQAPGHLYSGGWLLLEHGYDQGDAVNIMMTGAGFQQVSTRTDLAGHPRVCLGQWP
ncbi:MAG: peptide chain release factor N(5)-glutamine methyltransferase [Gammaproteobacteria bacterium]|nr:MAG: peptide chain release factor N(5)-glutamine methyltransferase [Gammaproteobacteria bacterium]